MRRKQLLTSDDAIQISRQHKSPCSNCPFSRGSLPGWLGGESVFWWMNVAHGDGRMECHTRLLGKKAAECAGAAIFRKNVCKSVLKGNLELPKNKETVFSHDKEFCDHHTGKNMTFQEIGEGKMKELFSRL